MIVDMWYYQQVALPSSQSLSPFVSSDSENQLLIMGTNRSARPYLSTEWKLSAVKVF